MTDKKWDGNAFRARMLSAAKESQRYSNEHNDRLKRGQPNGSASTRDEYFGMSVLCDVLSTSAATESSISLMSRLAELEENIDGDLSLHGIGDKEAYKRGYKSKIREIRREIEG